MQVCIHGINTKEHCDKCASSVTPDLSTLSDEYIRALKTAELADRRFNGFKLLFREGAISDEEFCKEFNIHKLANIEFDKAFEREEKRHPSSTNDRISNAINGN